MKNSTYNELHSQDKKLYDEAVKRSIQYPFSTVLSALRAMQESTNNGTKWIALHNLIVDEINE